VNVLKETVQIIKVFVIRILTLPMQPLAKCTSNYYSQQHIIFYKHIKLKRPGYA